MLRIEKNRTYLLRLMPNINTFPKHIMPLEYTETNKNFHVQKYFSYVLEQGNSMDILMYSNQIKGFVQQCKKGFYCTSEGYPLLEYDEEELRKASKYYYANEDKSRIYLDKEYIDEDCKKYTDIQFQPSINLFDVKSKYLLEFKTRGIKNGIMDLLQIYNVRVVEAVPLVVSDDEGKNMYATTETIEHCIEHVKEKLVNENKKLNFVFGEESKVVYWKQHLKESQTRVVAEPVESWFEDED